MPNASFAPRFCLSSAAHRGVATCSLPFVLISQTTYHLWSDIMTKCVRTNQTFIVPWEFCRYTTVSFEAASRLLVSPKERSWRQSAIQHVFPWAISSQFCTFIFYSPELTMDVWSNVLPTDYRCKQWKHSTKDFRTLLLNAKPLGYYVSVALMFCFYIHNHIHPPKTWFLQYLQTF